MNEEGITVLFPEKRKSSSCTGEAESRSYQVGWLLGITVASEDRVGGPSLPPIHTHHKVWLSEVLALLSVKR